MNRAPANGMAVASSLRGQRMEADNIASPRTTRIRTTDRRHLPLPVHANPQPSQQIALDTIDRCVRNDHAAMHSRELLRVEPLHQVLQQRANHEPFAGRDDFHVFLRSLEVQRIVDRYEARCILHAYR